CGAGADLHHRQGWEEPAADHARRQQHAAELVEVGARRGAPDERGFKMSRSRVSWMGLTAVLLLGVLVGACGKKEPPIARPMPPEAAGGTGGVAPPAPPEPVGEPVPVPPEPMAEDVISGKSLDDLNRDSPLQPVFFALD